MFFHQYEPLGDENLFEEFCKDALNLKHKTNSFEGYKTKGASQHGIDVYSNEFKIVIQCKKKQLLRSDKNLETELIKDLDESLELIKKLPFEFSSFILITTTKKFSKVQDYAIAISNSSNFNVIFWSWEDVQPLISQYSDLRKKYYPHLAGINSVFPKILTYLPKIKENEIFGRQDELLLIEEHLKTTSSNILLNSLGGVGKTTIAKLFINKNLHQYDHILWIDVYSNSGANQIDSSLSNLLEAFNGNIQLTTNLRIENVEEILPEDKFKIILNKLQSIEGNNILVIDNATMAINQYIDQLPGSPNWKIIITSREQILHQKCINIETLNKQECVSIFYSHYKKEKDDAVISEILNAVGFHTLTIELLSKVAEKRRMTLDHLKLLLFREGLNMSLNPKIISDHDPKKQPSTLFEYLSRIFHISDISDFQIEILRYLSILPSTYINYDDLKIFFQVEENDNLFFEELYNLVEKGWIKEQSGSYSLHQVQQEVLRFKLSPNSSNCSKLIKSLTSLLNINFEENPKKVFRFIPFASSVTHFIEDNLEICPFLNLLGLRYEDYGNQKEALKVHLRSLNIIEDNPKANLDDLATTYNNLQSIYKNIGDIDKALQFQLKDIKLKESYLDPLHPDNGASYNNLSLIYYEKGDLKEAFYYVKKALIIAESTLDGNHPNLASTYSTCSLILNGLGKLDASINYQERALQIRQSVLEPYHPQIAESLSILSSLYVNNEQFNKGEEYLLRSIEIKKVHYPEDHPAWGVAYSNLAALYYEKDLLDKAEFYQQKAIDIEEQALGAKHFTIATSYSTLSCIKMKQKQYLEAKSCIEKAINITMLTFPEGHPNLMTYYSFLHIIEEMLN